MSLKWTQFFILEAGSECNLGYCHAKCPNQTRKKGVRKLDEDTMVGLAIEAYSAHEFRGLIGFHYYNEPLVESALVFRVMQRVRMTIPLSRFILWTNGLLRPDMPEIAMFEQVYVSNYYDQEPVLREYFRHNPHVSIFTPTFDDRLAARLGPDSSLFCRRPLIEFIIDAWGRCRLCCQDWKGDVDLGDIWNHSLKECLEKRDAVLRTVCSKAMKPEAPPRCRQCTGRCDNHSFDPVIFTEGNAWADHL
jgi:hypothetical protein